MRVPVISLPYKVRSAVQEWKGWRISQYGFVWKEPCECNSDDGCLMDYYEDEEFCKCSERPPHTHTWAGRLGSKPIFFPKTNKGKK